MYFHPASHIVSSLNKLHTILTMTNSQSLKHHFLIAMPSLHDTNFYKSVIYLHEHSADGAMGLIINKPLQINLENILQHLKIDIDCGAIRNNPVIMGGPVQPEQGFVIHPSNPKKADDIDLTVSTSKDLLVAIAKGNGPEKFLITLGYSGWGSGQLEQELNRNDWLTAPLDPNIIFSVPIHQRWVKAAELLGININLMPDHFGHA